ncbi:MAG: hypothetical protein WBC92_04840, partial [Terracidiphilus sp.]
RVTIEEDFELERPVEVTLSLVTPRVPTVGNGGRITLKLGATVGRDALLSFDGRKLQPALEKIVLTDEHLRRDWGEAIYRILLKSQPVLSGRWTYELIPAQKTIGTTGA